MITGSLMRRKRVAPTLLIVKFVKSISCGAVTSRGVITNGRLTFPLRPTSSNEVEKLSNIAWITPEVPLELVLHPIVKKTSVTPEFTRIVGGFKVIPVG
jgi:hypothetical protein